MTIPIITAAIPIFASLALTISVSAQDLQALKVKASVSVAHPGQKFTVNSRIKNVALFGASKAVQSAYYLSTTPLVISPFAPRLSTFKTPSLKVGEAVTHSMTLTMPANITSGPYYLFVRADYNNTLLEFNELNNTAMGPLSGTTTDLTARLTAPGPLIAGTTITIKISARNGGTRTSLATNALLFLSKDIFITTSDVYLGSVNVPAISGGMTVEINKTVSLPYCSNSYTLLTLTSLGVIINPNSKSRVREENYSNNKSYLVRKVNPSTTKGRILQWWPTYSEDNIGPTTKDTATFRLLKKPAQGRLCITAPGGGLAPYILVMSASKTFSWDIFSDFGISALNGPMLPRWFGNLSLNGGASDIEFLIPQIPAHGFGVYIHHYYMTAKTGSFGNNSVKADFIK